jgi:hypothetical protein
MGKGKAKGGKEKRAAAPRGGAPSGCDADQMPLAHAIISGDETRVDAWLMGQWQRVGLREEPTPGAARLEKSYGEAFTGGKSTPVYYLSVPYCDWQGVIKLVQIKGANPIVSQSYGYEA